MNEHEQLVVEAFVVVMEMIETRDYYGEDGKALTEDDVRLMSDDELLALAGMS